MRTPSHTLTRHQTLAAAFLLSLTGTVATHAAAEGAMTTTGFLNQQLDVAGKPWRYVLYVPFEYDPGREWPLIVFLHGAGERGADGLLPTEVGIGGAIRRYPARFPALVLFPQCPPDAFWDAAIPNIEAAMRRTREQYRIDTRRIYLTGLSLGGYGTWIWGATMADTFAALMPICGGGSMLDIKAHVKKDMDAARFGTLEERVKKLAEVPIWAFHGEKDDVVPEFRSKRMVDLVKDAGGKVKYTVFKDTGHNAWDQAYADEKAIKWLFKQEKKR